MMESGAKLSPRRKGNPVLPIQNLPDPAHGTENITAGNPAERPDPIPMYLKWSVGIVVIMILFPPFHRVLGGGREFSLGYSFIFNPPRGGSIDASTLLMQVLFLLVVLALLIGLELYKRKKAMAG